MRPCREFLVVDPSELVDLLTDLAIAPDAPPRTYRRLQAIWARRLSDGLELNYLASGGTKEPFHLWRLRIDPNDPVPSLAPLVPYAASYEREITDLYGVRFVGLPDRRPLVLHAGFQSPMPPLMMTPQSRDALPFQTVPPVLPSMSSDELQLLQFGPIRADVVESGSFVFTYAGEGIVHLETRLFYKHRGMESRFEGNELGVGALLAERVSGIDSVAHALAFAMAVEHAIGIEVPRRAQQLRVLLAELERIYNHLQYFALLTKLTTLKVADAEGQLLAERAKQANARLTGSRFLRGLIVPGGLRADLEIDDLPSLIAGLGEQAAGYLGALERTRSYLDRLETTGILSPQLALAQGATGPVERASGLDRDLRRDHPYATYEEYGFVVGSAQAGDAWARAAVRREEILSSLAIVDQVLRSLEAGPICTPLPPVRDNGVREGLAWVEATRGTLIYAVTIAGGVVQRVKIKEPSFSNWRVFAYTVEGSNMMDYAINEASFGLSLAGNDR